MIYIVLIYTLVSFAAEAIPSPNTDDRNGTANFNSFPSLHGIVGFINAKRKKQFYFYSEEVEWEKASSLCKKYGKQLASIGNFEEEERIKKLILRGSLLVSSLMEVWVKTTYRGKEDLKMNPLGTPQTLGIFQPKINSKRQEKCISVRLNRTIDRVEWDRLYCGSPKAFICET